MSEEGRLKRSNHTSEQIFSKLGKVDRLLGERTPLVEVCQHPEFINAPCFRWDNLHGYAKTNDAKPVKNLERQCPTQAPSRTTHFGYRQVEKGKVRETFKPGLPPGRGQSSDSYV